MAHTAKALDTGIEAGSLEASLPTSDQLSLLFKDYRSIEGNLASELDRNAPERGARTHLFTAGTVIEKNLAAVQSILDASPEDLPSVAAEAVMMIKASASVGSVLVNSGRHTLRVNPEVGDMIQSWSANLKRLDRFASHVAQSGDVQYGDAAVLKQVAAEVLKFTDNLLPHYFERRSDFEQTKARALRESPDRDQDGNILDKPQDRFFRDFRRSANAFSRNLRDEGPGTVERIMNMSANDVLRPVKEALTGALAADTDGLAQTLKEADSLLKDAANTLEVINDGPRGFPRARATVQELLDDIRHVRAIATSLGEATKLSLAELADITAAIGRVVSREEIPR